MEYVGTTKNRKRAKNGRSGNFKDILKKSLTEETGLTFEVPKNSSVHKCGST